MDRKNWEDCSSFLDQWPLFDSQKQTKKSLRKSLRCVCVCVDKSSEINLRRILAEASVYEWKPTKERESVSQSDGLPYSEVNRIYRAERESNYIFQIL